MNNEEFDKYAIILRKSAKRGRKVSFSKIHLARKVLVDNEKITDVANEAGLKRQQLSKIVNMIRKIKENLRPEGFIDITITIPKEKERYILDIEKQEHISLNQEINKRT